MNNNYETNTTLIDNKFIEQQSQQMLLLVDIINAYTKENNELKQQIQILHNKIEYFNSNCINNNHQFINYLDFQNLIFFILLILLFILIFYIIYLKN